MKMLSPLWNYLLNNSELADCRRCVCFERYIAVRNRLVLSRHVTSFCFLPCWISFSSCCNCPDCFLERLCNFWDWTLLPFSFIIAVVIFSISDFLRNSLELIDCRNQIAGLKLLWIGRFFSSYWFCLLSWFFEKNSSCWMYFDVIIKS